MVISLCVGGEGRGEETRAAFWEKGKEWGVCGNHGVGLRVF